MNNLIISERQYRKIIIEEALLTLLDNNIISFEQLSRENLKESKIFNYILSALGGMALAAGHQAYELNAAQVDRAEKAVQMQDVDANSLQTKIGELDKLVNDNPRAWGWSPDSNSGESFPTIEIDGSQYNVMPATWTIANQVLQDKKAGTPNVPGFGQGVIPPSDVIQKALAKAGKGREIAPERAKLSQQNMSNYMKTFKSFMVPTSEEGSSMTGIGGQIYIDGDQTFQKGLVSVDSAVFGAQADYVLPDNGLTAQETYIQYYFGKYFSADEAELVF